MKYLFFLSFLCLLACGNEPSQSANQEQQTDPNSETTQTAPSVEPLMFTTNLDNIRLRSEPGTDGDELVRLPKGTTVFDVGEVSEFTTALTLRGVHFNEPWLKVKTEKGIEGWIYAGGLNFNMDKTHPLAEELMQKRLIGLFGKKIADALADYRNRYRQANTSKELAEVYIDGLTIRDNLVEVISEKIEVEYDKLPDLFWLEQAMPGYVTQLVAEGTVYYLFNDYKQFLQKAGTTSGMEDDAMAQLLLHIHAVDSVEYFYPSWFMQTWDYGGHSLLGQGIHISILKEMEAVLNQSTLFSKPISDLKNQLVNDITLQEDGYWEPRDKVIAELDEILKSGFKLFDQADVVALQTRRKMMDQPGENKIEFNVRAGTGG